MIHNLRGIVLWTRRGREADKIVGLYTDTLGRVTARATSASRAAARFASLTEPFVESELALYTAPGHAWAKIVGGRIARSYPALRTDLERSTAASWVCELMHRLTPEEQASPDKYALLVETLSALEEAPRFGVLRLAFAVRLLDLAGFGLDHREAWQDLEAHRPEWIHALRESPLADLRNELWQDPAVTAVERLAGSVVADQLSRPLHVNRFRQMTGIEI